MTNLQLLLHGEIGPAEADRLLSRVAVAPRIRTERGTECSRAAIAQALNLALLHRLLERSPISSAYFQELESTGRELVFDHGALRTVDLTRMGSLPRGGYAISRILEPLGYRVAETYPLDRLGMTGRAYCHCDFPSEIPQFFLSELHVDRFSATFAGAATRVTANSRDPLSAADRDSLHILSERHWLETAKAVRLLPALLACFDRQHEIPSEADYNLLLAESPEMAWIATEGNSFNHATDRVANIVEVADRQRQLDRPLKADLEISRSGRVIQTAFRADMVEREFVNRDGDIITRLVPGSFFEFIQRLTLPDSEQLDLSFDTGNAQGIFQMTTAKVA